MRIWFEDVMFQTWCFIGWVWGHLLSVATILRVEFWWKNFHSTMCSVMKLLLNSTAIFLISGLWITTASNPHLFLLLLGHSLSLASWLLEQRRQWSCSGHWMFRRSTVASKFLFSGLSWQSQAQMPEIHLTEGLIQSPLNQQTSFQSVGLDSGPNNKSGFFFLAGLTQENIYIDI